MEDRYLLDCTLRDGGYVNDWRFGHDKMMEIFSRLVSSGVEFIEVGFLDERRPYDYDRSIQPDTACYDKIYAGANKGDATVLAMIDYGTCSIEHLGPADASFIDGIRVIFKEHLRDQALAFCAEVKKLGYIVFAQMVSVTTYTDEALVAYAEKVNDLMPYATSMVDTYGLLDEEHLMHIARILDAHLDRRICLGYHAHNNFQLGYANAKHFLGSNLDRGLLADATLYGMGKSAGNAPLELLMMYRNTKQGQHYDVSQILEAIDDIILDIYQKQYWGYNLFFYIAASTHCHPNYVNYFMGQKTLSVKQILELLHALKPEKSLLYDAKYAEEMYRQYQDIECNDAAAYKALAKQVEGKELLLVGPGRNIARQATRVKNYIKEHHPLVIAVNYAPSDLRADAIFLTNAKRHTQLMQDLPTSANPAAQIIATSNVTKVSGRFDCVLNYSSLIDKDAETIDNSLLMMLKVLIQLDVKHVSLAGFDGFSKDSDNYFDISREYSFVKAKASNMNESVRSFLRDNKDILQVKFVTRSRYEE